MVRTDAGGSTLAEKVDLGNIQKDVIAAVNETYDLGSADKKWAALWVALALVTSITIGGVINLSEVEGVLFVNASSYINGSLEVLRNITAVNITADYFNGDGSHLSSVNYTETDPLWTGNRSNYVNFSKLSSFSYYNISDFDIDDYYLKSNPFNFYNSTTLVETDPLWTANYSAYNDSWSYYEADTNASTECTGTNYLGGDGNCYADSDSYPGDDFVNESGDTMTGNLDLTTKNISAIDCIVFDSGGKICSGV